MFDMALEILRLKSHQVAEATATFLERKTASRDFPRKSPACRTPAGLEEGSIGENSGQRNLAGGRPAGSGLLGNIDPDTISDVEHAGKISSVNPMM